MSSLRADGWQDIAAFLVMVISAVFIWYLNDLYINWIVVVVGTCSGMMVYGIFNSLGSFADDHPVVGFPITMVVILALLAAVMIRSLVAGVVAALVVATMIKIHDVYL